MTELALQRVQGNALAARFDSESMPELVRRDPATQTGSLLQAWPSRTLGCVADAEIAGLEAILCG